jgi:tetratricopeptide (TPR) repeat protein
MALAAEELSTKAASMTQTMAEYNQRLAATNYKLRAEGFDDFLGDLDYIQYTHRFYGVLHEGQLQASRNAACAIWVRDGIKASINVEPALVRKLADQIHDVPVFRASVVPWDRDGLLPFDPSGCHIVGYITNDEGKLCHGTYMIRNDDADEGFRGWLRLLLSTISVTTDLETETFPYMEAVRLNPNHALGYFYRGQRYLKSGEYNKAIADYTEGLRLDSNVRAAYADRGVAFERVGDYDNAIADFTEVIRRDPNNADAYSERGAAYMKKGERVEAEADFAKAKELWREN